MRALPFALLLILARPAAALLPLPGPAPDWKEDRRQVLAEYRRLDDAFPDIRRRDDREIQRLLAKVRRLAQQIEDQERNDRDKALMWVRNYGIPGQDPGEISTRIRWIYDVHMHVVYGWMLPQIVNDAFADAAKTMAIPGYPLPHSITDAEYCRDDSPVAREITELLAGQSPVFAPRGGKSFCDTVVGGRAAD